MPTTLPSRICGRHGLLLGWEHRSGEPPSPIWDDESEGHLVTIAPTGAGKGVSAVIPALLTWQGPAIVIDPKGENYAVTAARRQALGQRVHVLDGFGVTSCAETARLNPMDMIAGETLEDDAWLLADTLAMFRFKSDPFWDDRAVSMIAETIAHFHKHKSRTKRTLLEVRKRIERENGMDHVPAFFARAYGEPPKPNDLVFRGYGSSRTLDSVVATAMSHLSLIRHGPVARVLSNSTIKLGPIRDGAAETIYIVLPPDKLISHARLLRLWLAVILTTLARRLKVPDVPTLLLVDEAANIGPLPPLLLAVTLLRSYGVRVWTFWQDISQIKSVYPQDWQTLLNNSSTQQILGATSPLALSELRSYLGEGLAHRLPHLGSDEMVLIRPRRRPSIVGRPDYRTDLMFHGMASPNPLHAHKRGAPLSGAAGADDKVVAFPSGDER